LLRGVVKAIAPSATLSCLLSSIGLLILLARMLYPIVQRI